MTKDKKLTPFEELSALVWRCERMLGCDKDFPGDMAAKILDLQCAKGRAERELASLKRRLRELGA